MAKEQYIAVIDLETSRFTGVVAKKEQNGFIDILAHVSENALDSMRHGKIVKTKEATGLIKKLVSKLKNALLQTAELKGKEFEIKKLYFGVNCQSLKSIEATESIAIPYKSFVTTDDVESLLAQCAGNMSEDYIPLDMLPPTYYADNKPVKDPKGLECNRLKANFRLIAALPYVRSTIEHVAKGAGYELAQILASPVALAEALTDKSERETGCIFVDFGRYVTSVVVFRDGEVLNLGVVPFGYSLIISDLAEGFDMKDSKDAEQLLFAYANCSEHRSDDAAKTPDYIVNSRKYNSITTDLIATARAKEIIANAKSIAGQTLTDGIVRITGQLSDAKGISKLTASIFGLEVGQTDIPAEWGNYDRDEFAAISLLTRAKDNCLTVEMPPEPNPPIDGQPNPDNSPDDPDEPVNPIASLLKFFSKNKDKPKKEKEKGDSIGKKFGNFVTDMASIAFEE